MTTTRESILALAQQLPVESLSLPALGEVHLRGITGAERDAYEQSCIEMRGGVRIVNMRNARARLLVRSLCDESGKRLFADADDEALGGVPAQVLDQMYAVAARLSGLGARDAEELAGN